MPPQDSFDYSGLPDTSPRGFDYSGLPDQDQEESSGGGISDFFTLPNAVRFGASTLGDLTSWTGVGPFLGGAIGEGVGRYMEGQPFDLGIMATEGALNYLPGAGRLERQGLGALGKYALKSAAHGVGQGVVGAFPRHQANEGNLFTPSEWEMPSFNEVAGQGVAGGVMGGVLGGAMGKYQQMHLPTPPVPKVEPPPFTPPPPPSGIAPSTNPFDQRMPLGSMAPNTPEQGGLDFSVPPPPPMGQIPLDFGPPPPGSIGPSPQVVNGKLPRVISLQEPNPLKIRQQEERGYVLWPGHVNKNGWMQMILKDQLPPDPATNIQNIQNQLQGMVKNPIQPQPEVQSQAPQAPTHVEGPNMQGLEGYDTPEGHVVVLNQPDASMNNILKGLGYTPYKTNAQGRMQMIRRGQPAAVPVPPVESAPMTGTIVPALGDNSINFNPRKPVTIPKDRMNQNVLNNLTKGGFKQIGQDAQGNSIFQRINDVSEMEGPPIDINEYRRQFESQFPPTEGQTNDPLGNNLGTTLSGLTDADLRQLDSVDDFGNPLSRGDLGLDIDEPINNDIGGLRQQSVLGPHAAGPEDVMPPVQMGQQSLPLGPHGELEARNLESDGFIDSARNTPEVIPTTSPEQMYFSENRGPDPNEGPIIPDENQIRDMDPETSAAFRDDVAGYLDHWHNQFVSAAESGDLEGMQRAQANINKAEKILDQIHKSIPTPDNPRANLDKNQAIIDADHEFNRAEDLINDGAVTEADLTIHKAANKLESLGHREEADEMRWNWNELRKDFDNGDGYTSEMARNKSNETWINMKPGDREEMLRGTQGKYSEHGAKTANKELLNNAIDATPDGGTVTVDVDHKGKKITVTDQGSGLTLNTIQNEYVTMTGSGKRGVPVLPGGRKPIGEMGEGKATYLLGPDKFEVDTVAVEADGSKWRYTFSGTPEEMITSKIKVNKERVSPDTQTGTKVTIYDSKEINIINAEFYLKKFAKYSNSPVNVIMKGNKYEYAPDLNLNEHVKPRTMPVGEVVASGSLPGGDYTISIPPDVKWNDRAKDTTAILNARGAFQGTQTIPIYPQGILPEHLIIDINPTVSSNDGKLYPLTSPTREFMKEEFSRAIAKEIKTKISDVHAAREKANVQIMYDNLQPATNVSGQSTGFVTYDSGSKYTPEELARFSNSPRIQAIASVMKKALDQLATYFPDEHLGKTTKFGFYLHDPHKGGLNVRNPSSDVDAKNAEFAILVNLQGAIANAMNKGGGPSEASQLFVHNTGHEFTHNIVRTEDDAYTWKFQEIMGKWPLEDQLSAKQSILAALTGKDGNYDPEIQGLLRDYFAARGRENTTPDLLSKSRESQITSESTGPSGTNGINGSDGGGTTAPVAEATETLRAATKDPNFLDKTKDYIKNAIDFTRGGTTVLDLSASFRQGLPLIGTKAWRGAWSEQLKALGSEGAFQKQLDDIYDRPMFQERLSDDGRTIKSYAERAGIKIMELGDHISSREESAASTWVESGQMFGKSNPLQRGYAKTIGKGARASNRAYTAFLNKLRADTFEDLIKSATADFDAGLAGAKNPMEDMVFAREIADYVNTVTGRGPLKMARPTIEGGKIGLKETSLEQHAKLLTHGLFAPRLFFSRARMLNPATYMMASPQVRKQYTNSLIRTAGAWGVISGLGAMAGQAGLADVEVSTDPNSADFGKMRIGNTRLDPAGGFQQYLVAASRLISGRTTSSATQRDFELGVGYHADTRKDISERFMTNKLSPIYKFGYDLLNASQYQPFHVGDRAAQLFVPLIVQDVIELAQEDPSLLPLLGPIALGMGSQTYSKGESVGKFINPDNDWLIQGGDPRNFESEVLDEINPF